MSTGSSGLSIYLSVSAFVLNGVNILTFLSLISFTRRVCGVGTSLEITFILSPVASPLRLWGGILGLELYYGPIEIQAEYGSHRQFLCTPSAWFQRRAQTSTYDPEGKLDEGISHWFQMAQTGRPPEPWGPTHRSTVVPKWCGLSLSKEAAEYSWGCLWTIPSPNWILTLMKLPLQVPTNIDDVSVYSLNPPRFVGTRACRTEQLYGNHPEGLFHHTIPSSSNPGALPPRCAHSILLRLAEALALLSLLRTLVCVPFLVQMLVEFFYGQNLTSRRDHHRVSGWGGSGWLR
ncbi:uncharacterized protein BT62DRAFT_252008 [Guyanagaster necrorhizus]|uniref:Uncharacterized protein n=1 Tax=Guyanagaster necrorhizus TaxID=856835 RepID=A0A9P8AQ86_9AGAR|nr:uncharacterized protein BT62DRAFT_252008 [Guyanagaster necrorhizus MCA 3950]KAG7444108.1 hypothetical protein BT62DRAFT_252008 [Guyanagaster necrorhizus MCA 3950]